MPGADVEKGVEGMKGSPLTDEEKKEVERRLIFAKRWIEKAAPPEYVYELQKELPPELELTEVQCQALSRIADLLEEGKRDEELHTAHL